MFSITQGKPSLSDRKHRSLTFIPRITSVSSRGRREKEGELSSLASLSRQNVYARVGEGGEVGFRVQAFLQRGTMSSSSTTLGVRILAPHRAASRRHSKTTLSNLAFFLLFRTPLSLASLATVSRGNVLRKRNQPTNCCPIRCASANADLRDLSIGRFFRGFDR